MSFKDAGWSARFGKLGDLAEEAFENWCDQNNVGYVRCGLNRPPLAVQMLPARVRYWPDYLLTHRFVEVQGLGRDQTFKLKIAKANSLHWWANVHPVELFVYDSHKKRDCFLPLTEFDKLLGTAEVEIRTFPEGTPYYAIKAADVFDAADGVEVAA